jgi:hypothetical protein
MCKGRILLAKKETFIRLRQHMLLVSCFGFFECLIIAIPHSVLSVLVVMNENSNIVPCRIYIGAIVLANIYPSIVYCTMQILVTGTIVMSSEIPVHAVLSHLSSYFEIYQQQIMLQFLIHYQQWLLQTEQLKSPDRH